MQVAVEPAIFYAANTKIGFCHDHALVLYVYLPNEGDSEDSILTASPLMQWWYIKC